MDLCHKSLKNGVSLGYSDQNVFKEKFRNQMIPYKTEGLLNED